MIDLSHKLDYDYEEEEEEEEMRPAAGDQQINHLAKDSGLAGGKEDPGREAVDSNHAQIQAMLRRVSSLP